MLVKFVLLFAAVLIKCIVYVSPHLEFACHKFQQITLILKPITSNISPKIPLEGSNTGSHYLNMHSVIREIITCSDSDFSHFKHKNKVFNLYRFYLLFSPCAPFFFCMRNFTRCPKLRGKKKRKLWRKKKKKKKRGARSHKIGKVKIDAVAKKKETPLWSHGGIWGIALPTDSIHRVWSQLLLRAGLHKT